MMTIRVAFAGIRPWLLASGLVVLAAQASVGQSAAKHAFGKWNASVDRDLMTDSTKSSETTVRDNSDEVDLVVECTNGRVSEAHFTLDQLYGDSASTIRLRFGTRPPASPTRWIRKTLATDQQRQEAREGLASTDPLIRQLSKQAASLAEFVFFTEVGAEAGGFTQQLSTAAQLRVEFTPGANAQSQLLQAAFDISGLSDALKWMHCRP